MSRYGLILPHYFRSRESYETAEAFAALYEQTHLIVFRYIYALHGEPKEDAEDLWMETFLKAWHARHRFTGNEDAALGWLLQIARNLVIDRHRQQQRRSPRYLQDMENLPMPANDTPEQYVMMNEQHQAIIAMLDTLPDQQREMVVLRHIVGWRVKDIARHLDIPENTVSVTLRRALEKLSQSEE